MVVLGLTFLKVKALYSKMFFVVSQFIFGRCVDSTETIVLTILRIV